MAGEISNYSIEVTTIEGNIDLVDVSVLISTGPDVYDSQKAKAEIIVSQRMSFGLTRKYKDTGNTDLNADETGDWRQRVDNNGDFVHEVFNGATWDVKSKFLA